MTGIDVILIMVGSNTVWYEKNTNNDASFSFILHQQISAGPQIL